MEARLLRAEPFLPVWTLGGVLPRVQFPLPSLSEHPRPRVDHLLLWVAEWPLGGLDQ